MKKMSEPLSDKIRDIKLTEEGKRPPKPVFFITDSEMAQFLDDPVKVEIIQVLREGIEDTQTTEKYHEKTKETVIRQWPVKRFALSVAEIVKQSKRRRENPLSRNQVYHHLPGLIKSGYIKKFGTVTTGKRTTDYFRRTTETFVLPKGTPAIDEKFLAKQLASDVEYIDRVFGFSIPKTKHQEFIQLGIKMWEIRDEWAGTILQNLKEDLVDSRSLKLYDWLFELTMLGIDEYIELGRRMRELLFMGKTE